MGTTTIVSLADTCVAHWRVYRHRYTDTAIYKSEDTTRIKPTVLSATVWQILVVELERGSLEQLRTTEITL